ncbi:hypothetical protein D3C73_1059120 [compost metagenome]
MRHMGDGVVGDVCPVREWSGRVRPIGSTNVEPPRDVIDPVQDVVRVCFHGKVEHRGCSVGFRLGAVAGDVDELSEFLVRHGGGADPECRDGYFVHWGLAVAVVAFIEGITHGEGSRWNLGVLCLL